VANFNPRATSGPGILLDARTCLVLLVGS